MSQSENKDTDVDYYESSMKYYEDVPFRGYTIHIEYNTESAYYNYQNFENNILKRAMRFVGGTGLYIANPILGGTEMVAAVLSNVFVKEGHKVTSKLKNTQCKMYNTETKIDATVLSRCTGRVKLALNCLKEYQKSKKEDDFRYFYEKVYSSLGELSQFLEENKPNPGFMNAVTTLTKLIEEGVKSISYSNSKIPENIEFKYQSIKDKVDETKTELAIEWERCIKHFQKHIHYGHKKIKK